MAKRYELTDAQWDRISALLPGKSSDPGRTASDNRLFVNGVLWVLRSGAHWHDLPERYGKYKSIHKRFSRWAKAAVDELLDAVGQRPGQEPAPVGRGRLTKEFLPEVLSSAKLLVCNSAISFTTGLIGVWAVKARPPSFSDGSDTRSGRR